ncbi:hypothetical protein L4C36_22380 [Photobacterium japonica]|uniref:hypothetical protein n=1 Tax=Photobacterium japonica TaxID=2910235 RepID=UPI003D0DDF12
MGSNKWTIAFGGKTKEQLLLELSTARTNLNAYATLLFMSDRFHVSPSQQRTEVVEISVQTLGFEEGAVFADIVRSAASQGLSLCSLELAVYLRLHYQNQPEGNQVTIASKRAFLDENYPNGFYLRAQGDALGLRGYRATSDWVWPADSLFIFEEQCV